VRNVSKGKISLDTSRTGFECCSPIGVGMYASSGKLREELCIHTSPLQLSLVYLLSNQKSIHPVIHTKGPGCEVVLKVFRD
jgi:hypothetical protein